MKYSDKLKDPRWQRKRLKILERDNFTCQSCECKTKTLHVHHLIYFMGCDPWDYDDKFLITLCMDCHESEEIIKKVLDGELAFSLNAIGFPTITVLRLVLRDEERLQRNIEIYRKGGKIA